MESTGDMDNALQYYENAQDYLSLVRVYCYCGQLDKVSLSGSCFGLMQSVTIFVTDSV